jgi:hypothetical protein
VFAFNTVERWSQDVSEDVAREIRRRFDLQLADVPSNLQADGGRVAGSRRRAGLARWRNVFEPRQTTT